MFGIKKMNEKSCSYYCKGVNIVNLGFEIPSTGDSVSSLQQLNVVVTRIYQIQIDKNRSELSREFSNLG